MKVECSQFSPNIEQMAIKDKCNISHQLLVTAIVFQDMTLVVWNTFPDCFFYLTAMLFMFLFPVILHICTSLIPQTAGGEEVTAVPAIFPLVACPVTEFLECALHHIGVVYL